MIISRREFLGLSAAALAALSAGCKPKKQERKLRIGYLPITDASPLLAAYDRGFFRAEGLDAEKPILLRSWPALIEAFLGGKVDLVHLLYPAAIWLKFSGSADIKIVAWNHVNGSALTVSEKSSIKSFSDFGGKKVAVPHWYSVHNCLLQEGLRAKGLTPVLRSSGKLKDNETSLVLLPPPEMTPSLASGKIDAFIVAEPFNAMAQLKAGAKIMRLSADMWKEHPCCVAVMRSADVDKNPDYCQAAVNALVRAHSWLSENRDEAAHILSRDGAGYLPASQNELEHVLCDHRIASEVIEVRHPQWQSRRIDFHPWPHNGAASVMLDLMKRTRVEGSSEFLSSISAQQLQDLTEFKFIKNKMGAQPARRELLEV